MSNSSDDFGHPETGSGSKKRFVLEFFKVESYVFFEICSNSHDFGSQIGVMILVTLKQEVEQNSELFCGMEFKVVIKWCLPRKLAEVKWVCYSNWGVLKAANRISNVLNILKYYSSAFQKNSFLVCFFYHFFETADLRSCWGYFLEIC